MKKAECIIHFCNYLMEREDTTRTNTLSLDTLPTGFQLMGLLTGRQSCQASHTTSSTSLNPTGFDAETRPGSNQWTLWYWERAVRTSSCMPREVIPRLPWCFRWGEDWGLRASERTMKSPGAATAGCIFRRHGGNCQTAEPWFSGWGCVCESHSAMIRKVKLSAENNILVKHS